MPTKMGRPKILGENGARLLYAATLEEKERELKEKEKELENQDISRSLEALVGNSTNTTGMPNLATRANAPDMDLVQELMSGPGKKTAQDMTSPDLSYGRASYASLPSTSMNPAGSIAEYLKNLQMLGGTRDPRIAMEMAKMLPKESQDTPYMRNFKAWQSEPGNAGKGQAEYAKALENAKRGPEKKPEPKIVDITYSIGGQEYTEPFGVSSLADLDGIKTALKARGGSFVKVQKADGTKYSFTGTEQGTLAFDPKNPMAGGFIVPGTEKTPKDDGKIDGFTPEQIESNKRAYLMALKKLDEGPSDLQALAQILAGQNGVTGNAVNQAAKSGNPNNMKKVLQKEYDYFEGLSKKARAKYSTGAAPVTGQNTKTDDPLGIR